MIGTRVAFRGAFGPHQGIVLEETEDSVVLAVENRDESNFRPLPFEILSSLLGLNRTRTGISTTGEGLCRYRRWKRAIRALVRRWSFDEPVHHPEPGKRTFWLCARRTTGLLNRSHRGEQAASQSCAYFRPQSDSAIYNRLKNICFLAGSCPGFDPLGIKRLR